MVVHEFLFPFHRGHEYLYVLQWSMLGHGTDKGFPWIFAVFIFFLKEKKKFITITFLLYSPLPTITLHAFNNLT